MPMSDGQKIGLGQWDCEGISSSSSANLLQKRASFKPLYENQLTTGNLGDIYVYANLLRQLVSGLVISRHFLELGTNIQEKRVPNAIREQLYTRRSRMPQVVTNLENL